MLSHENRRLIAPAASSSGSGRGPETLAARVGDGAGRPLLGDDPAEAVVRLNAVRAPLYAEVADVVIDVDELAPDDVADRIVDAAGRRRRPDADARPPPPSRRRP